MNIKADNNKQPDNTNPNPETKPETQGSESIDQLKEQIENLNKGIASYRKDAKEYKDLNWQLQQKLDQLSEKEGEKKEGKSSDLPDLSDSDKKRLEQWAKAQGFVTKEELDKEKQRIQGDNLKQIETQAVDEFIKQHPEYDSDEQWDKLKQEFGQYKQPTTITEYRKILNKIHKDLNPDDVEGKVKAKMQDRNRLGLGGGSQKSNDDSDEFQKMTEKYPNLSEDQIRARLSEIEGLYKDK